MKKTVANKGQRPKTLTGRTVKRIARAVNAFERGDRNVPGRRFRRGVAASGGETVRLGKTTAAWNKGDLATIDLYPAGTPGSEATGDPAETLEDCVNKFSNVPADKWVIVALADNDAWYLIAAEC